MSDNGGGILSLLLQALSSILGQFGKSNCYRSYIRAKNRKYRSGCRGITVFQITDILDLMQSDSGINLKELRVDGGQATEHSFLMHPSQTLQYKGNSSQSRRIVYVG